MTTTASGPALTHEEALRYSRHLILPEVGVPGQLKLRQAKVLLVGAGGLGSPLALYLAAAGVGTLGLVDFDLVDLSNLQRQILHGTGDVGRSKLESARRRIADVNPHVRLDTYETRLAADNALDLIRGHDLVVDGTDNFATRYLVNDACVLLGVPNVYGSIFRFEGQASVFATKDGPCYRCLFPKPPPAGLVPSCAEGGVLGVLPGLVGTIQATEALKLLLGAGEPLIGRLLLVDALTMQFRTVRVRKDPACPACGTREITELREEATACEAPGQAEEPVPELGPRQLAARLARRDDLLLVDVREPHEWEICRLPGAELIPLGTIPDAAQGLPRDRELVVYCKGGARSARAVRFLRRQGFDRVLNLTGGITRWSEEVDPAVPRY
ncbi:MAG TPA: molybdopterin-synthase adenylyltransferase MoeB [Gemmatimonadales bacterium]|jgi:adenylyltransferase/sulfurtransferase|nr:molybdopterin-synthase adenylyltransferase MoeB [Gemmatimonadales bacterium]